MAEAGWPMFGTTRSVSQHGLEYGEHCAHAAKKESIVHTVQQHCVLVWMS